MRQIISVTYPVPAQVLLRALSDLAFREDKIQAIGSLHSQVLEHAMEGDVFSLPMIGALERFIAAELPRLMEQEASAGRPLLGRYA